MNSNKKYYLDKESLKMKLLQAHILPKENNFIVTVLVNDNDSIKAFQSVQNQINSDSLQNTIDYGLTLHFNQAKDIFVDLKDKTYSSY